MYLLFGYDYYYPQEGSLQCLGVFDTVDQAKAVFAGEFEAAEIALLIPPSHGQPGRLQKVAEAFTDPGTKSKNIQWRDIAPLSNYAVV